MPNPKIIICFGVSGSKWASLGANLAAGAAFNQRLRIRRPWERASVGWATRLPSTDLSWLGEASYCSFLTMSWYIFVAKFMLACLVISCCIGFRFSAWLELALLLALLLASVLTTGAGRAGLGCEGLGLLDLLSELPVLLRSTSNPVSSRMTIS